MEGGKKTHDIESRFNLSSLLLKQKNILFILKKLLFLDQKN